MKPFGWGRLRGRRPATRITLNFLVTVGDMIFILAQWSEANRDAFDMNEFLTPHQTEQIIRRAYSAGGEGVQYSEWDKDVTDIQRRRAFRWAQRQARHAFPEQYEASRKEEWL